MIADAGLAKESLMVEVFSLIRGDTLFVDPVLADGTLVHCLPAILQGSLALARQPLEIVAAIAVSFVAVDGLLGKKLTRFRTQWGDGAFCI
jgi:hypothetical protein